MVKKMKSLPTPRILIVTLVAVSMLTVAAAARAATNAQAATTISTIKKRDPGIDSFFKSSYAYAVFPTIGKGGIGIGGAFGTGIVYRQGKRIGTAKMTQLSIGFQLGGQAYSEVIFFQDAATFTRFTNGQLKFGAGVSAVAVKTGAARRASFSRGVAIFTMTKGGLMYEASLSGQEFEYKKD